MGLLKVIRKTKIREKELRILILGLDNAGKTTILKKLNEEDVSKIEPTVGFNIKTLRFKEYILNFWDIGGQKSIRVFWNNYFENTDAIIWVIDSIDVFRLNLSKNEIINLLTYNNLYNNIKLLIFANKQDIPGSISIDQIDNELNLNKVMSRENYNIVATSAFNGQGIIDGINWLITSINK